jgi:hypothetical protein
MLVLVESYDLESTPFVTYNHIYKIKSCLGILLLMKENEGRVANLQWIWEILIKFAKILAICIPTFVPSTKE